MRNFILLKKIIFIVFVLTVLIRCNGLNAEKIIVKGHITDSLTNLPIKKTKVTIVCWYDAGWDKTDYESIDTITNDDGSFNVAFEEGYKIIVASVSSNYNPTFKEVNYLSNPINLNLKLVQSNSNDTNKINLRKFIINNTEN